MSKEGIIEGSASGDLNDVKHHGDADEGVQLQQGEGMEEPPDADHDQELGVQLKTGKKAEL